MRTQEFKRALNWMLLCVGVVLVSNGQMVSQTLENKNPQIIGKSAKKAISFSRMPMAFTENKGQWEERVFFRADGGNFTAWFGRDKVWYQFTRRSETKSAPSNSASNEVGNVLDGCTETTLAISATIIGTNPNPEIVGDEQMEYKCNYFLGRDQSQWHADVPNYKTIIYKEIYPGIDLKYYGNGDGRLEYDFIVSPGADPSKIAIRYDGAKAVGVNGTGELVVETEWGKIIEHAPLVYQVVDGKQKQIKAEYCLREKDTFGFKLGCEFDPQYAVVLDPVLTYSTYLGGSDADYGLGIAVDGSGNAYVTGRTLSTDFPTLSHYQGEFQGGDWDAFVTKLNNSGTALVYSTYLGGNDQDEGNGIAVDGSGNVYVAGYTGSSDFPTQNPYQATLKGSDVFVTKLNSTGNSLVYSTLLGGTGTEFGTGVAIDNNGYAYVTGYTSSTDFPTRNPIQSTNQGGFEYDDRNIVNLVSDAFVTKLGSSGNSLIYSTYLGGSGTEGYMQIVGPALYVGGIAVDASGNAYVVGCTNSDDFSVNVPTQTYQDSVDVFVTKLNSSGTAAIYSTYLGGGSHDIGFGIAVDAGGNAYVVGYTESTDFPISSAYQSSNGGYEDVFVTRLSGTGDISYSTYLGGDGSDFGYAIAVDGDGKAYLTGRTFSYNFPSQHPIQPTVNYFMDAFVTTLNSNGENLIFSSFLGGGAYDFGYGIAVDAMGNAYVTGETWSTDFPTQGPIQTDQGSFDSFVAKIGDIYDDVIQIEEPTLPSAYRLDQNYPNPFNPTTRIEFAVSRPGDVRIEVINMLGQTVCTLVDQFLTAGTYATTWKGTDSHGNHVASGNYFYRLQAGDQVETKKMVMLK